MRLVLVFFMLALCACAQNPATPVIPPPPIVSVPVVLMVLPGSTQLKWVPLDNVTLVYDPAMGTLRANGSMSTISWAAWYAPAGAIDGSNQTFTLMDQPIPQSLAVSLNGALLAQGIDYSLSAPNAILFAIAPPAGSILQVTYRK